LISGSMLSRWKRLTPRTLISGLKGKTKLTQSVHCPARNGTFCPLTAISIDCRSSATLIVIGILMYGGFSKSLFGGP
jgi:hypothetical protein